jgi:hypothetical protein
MPKKDRMQEYNAKLQELEEFKSKGQVNYKGYLKQKRKIESQKPLSMRAKVILWSVLGCIILFIIIGVANTEPAPQPQKPTNYNYKFTKIDPLDPTTVQFGLEISNPTDVAWEKPSCTVTIQNSTGHYRGFDTFFIDKTIPPKSSHTFVGNLVITNQGAAYVDKYEVDCN